ncbi:unnamed protein product, partial [Didymodactylos carnosus]
LKNVSITDYFIQSSPKQQIASSPTHLMSPLLNSKYGISSQTPVSQRISTPLATKRANVISPIVSSSIDSMILPASDEENRSPSSTSTTPVSKRRTHPLTTSTFSLINNCEPSALSSCYINQSTVDITPSKSKQPIRVPWNCQLPTYTTDVEQALQEGDLEKAVKSNFVCSTRDFIMERYPETKSSLDYRNISLSIVRKYPNVGSQPNFKLEQCDGKVRTQEMEIQTFLTTTNLEAENADQAHYTRMAAEPMEEVEKGSSAHLNQLTPVLSDIQIPMSALLSQSTSAAQCLQSTRQTIYTPPNDRFYERVKKKVKQLSTEASLMDNFYENNYETQLNDTLSSDIQTTAEEMNDRVLSDKQTFGQRPTVIRVVQRNNQNVRVPILAANLAFSQPFLRTSNRAIAAKTVPARQSNDIETQSMNISCTIPKNPDPLSRIKSMSNSAMERNYQHLTEELRNKVKQIRNIKHVNIPLSIVHHIKRLQQMTFLSRRSLMENQHNSSSLSDKITLYPELLNEFVILYEHQLLTCEETTTNNNSTNFELAMRKVLDDLIQKYKIPQQCQSQADFSAVEDLCNEQGSKCFIMKELKKGHGRQLGLYFTGNAWEKAALQLTTNTKINVGPTASGLQRPLLVFLVIFQVLQYNYPDDIKAVMNYLNDHVKGQL